MSSSIAVDVNAARSRALKRSPEPSGMLDSCNAIDRLREVLPDRSLAHERAAPARREAVVAAPALPRLLDPAAFDHALALEAIQCRVERGDVERDGAVRSLF